jgi:hypothetical protein
MPQGIAAGLPKGDQRLPIILAATESTSVRGVGAVTGKHYEGGHGLGKFRRHWKGHCPKVKSQCYAPSGTTI